MQCVKCGRLFRHVENFCPFCGKELNTYQNIKRVSKKQIDEAMEKNNFDFLWNLIDEGNEPYAEYKYERMILQRAEKIDTPNDFEAFTCKIKGKSDNGNVYAKYLYGKTMRSVFRERGILSGLAFFVGNPQKHKDGTDLIKEAALRGQTSAEWTFGYLMWEGDKDTDIAQNKREAFRYISRAAEKGHPRAMLKLGEIYNEGMAGLERDYQKAVVWVKAAEYFGCKTDKVNIYHEHVWVHEKDIEEIEEFYGLGKFSGRQGSDMPVIQVDFS